MTNEVINAKKVTNSFPKMLSVSLFFSAKLSLLIFEVVYSEFTNLLCNSLPQKVQAQQENVVYFIRIQN